MKHTKGPWVINFQENPIIRAWNNLDNEGYDVASLSCDETGDYLANAKLIAASPEMLELLKNITKEQSFNEFATNVEMARNFIKTFEKGK